MPAELADWVAAAEGAAASPTALALNSLYALGARARAARGRRDCVLLLELGLAARAGEFVVLRELRLWVPVVRGADRAARIGGRAEACLFVATDSTTNALRWSAEAQPDTDVELHVRRILVEPPRWAAFGKVLRTVERRRRFVGGRLWRPFAGVEAAHAHLDRLEQALVADDVPLPALWEPPRAPATGGDAAESPRIGLVGEDSLAEMIDTVLPCLRVGPQHVDLVRSGALDLIAVQRRAVGIAPESLSSSAESAFVSELAGALADCAQPVVELADEPGAPAGVVLRPLRNGRGGVEVRGAEYELAQFGPLRGPTWDARAIALPCASDLYQSGAFQAAAEGLLAAGYRLVLSESTYDHAPVKTWERFRSPRVKCYGRLSMRSQSALFQNCGFVLLPSAGLRPLADVANLCAVALQSGSMPLVLGAPLPAPIDALAESLPTPEALKAYLAENTDELTRERLWLARFRSFVARADGGRLRDALRDLAAGRPIVRAPVAPASAELICVSKRPENLQAIADNYRRQDHPNLGLHLVWNVRPEAARECIARTDGLALPNLRVSVLDESHNIGACLNHGRRLSMADFWFKFDDDDYYGRNYVRDSINYYRFVGADAVARPPAFVHFTRSQEVYLRRPSGRDAFHVARTYPDKPYLCGATLSGRRSADLPLFSNHARNACDSRWMESLPPAGFRIFATDPFNHVTFRGDASAHTWQASDDFLTKNAQQLAPKFVPSVFDAA